jgi:hypothetical protein
MMVEIETGVQGFPHIYPIEVQLRFLLRYAILAPSTRNTQPWRFTVDGNRVLVRADLTRWHRVADADRRELYLSLGCALENLLVAAEQLGFRCSVLYQPDAPDEQVAAAISFHSGGHRSPERAGLSVDTIVARRAAHGRFSRAPVSGQDRLALERCATDIGVELTFITDPEIRASVGQLHRRAHDMLLADPAFRQELAGWIGEGAFGTPWPFSRLGGLAVGNEAVARQLARLDAIALESSPLLALISSAHDHRPAQVMSGQLLERLWLTATSRELGLQPLSATLEVPELRARLTALTCAPLPWAQQLVRIGHPRKRSGHRTPRRSIDEVIDPVEPGV